MHVRDCSEHGVKLRAVFTYVLFRFYSSTFFLCICNSVWAWYTPWPNLVFPQPEIAGRLVHRAYFFSGNSRQFFAPSVPPHSLQEEARLHLERAAFLHFAPARYKFGHPYKFALPTFLFDALLGVQYYTLTSRQGEVKAQNLAFTFTEKAARKGLGSAEFAMGY